MPPILTDIPQLEANVRRASYANCIERKEANMHLANRYSIPSHCYAITAVDFGRWSKVRGAFALSSTDPGAIRLDEQASFISLANSLFKNTKPLAGKEMDVLQQTFNRLRSSVPTSL